MSVLSSSSHDTIPSQLVLFFFVAKVVDQSGDAVFEPALPGGPRLGTEGFIPEIVYRVHTRLQRQTAEQGGEEEKRASHLCRKASKRRRYAKPALLTLRFSIRPRYLTWCLTRTSSNLPTQRWSVHWQSNPEKHGNCWKHGDCFVLHSNLT